MQPSFTSCLALALFSSPVLIGCSAGSDESQSFSSAQYAAELTVPSIAECVSQEVARHGGDAAAVTDLECGLPTAEPCAEGAAEDVSSLTTLRNLRGLNLGARCLHDARPLALLTKLERLELSNNRIEDIRPLAALTELQYLGLEGNPLVDTWGTETQEPFLHWRKLRELDLDSTGIEYLFPLWRLTSLETLSIRDNYLWSLRQITRMTWLRRLYADGNVYVEDLSPLAGFEQLEELSIEGGHVASIEPLRPLLASTGAGRLRKVSLRGNFIASCAALEGIEYDCTEQQSGWESLLPIMFSRGISSPVEAVESFAPTHLPIWTLAELARGFELIRSAPIRWNSPSGGCDGRAHESAALLASSGFPRTTTAHAFGNLRPLTPNFPTGYVSFDWHIALAVRGELEGGGVGYYVFDPAFEEGRPLLLREWFARLVDSTGHSLDTSCSLYAEHSGYVSACDPEVNPVAIDAQGNLEVDRVNELFGLVCPLESCTTT